MENEYNLISCGCKTKRESSLYTYIERARGFILKKKSKVQNLVYNFANFVYKIVHIAIYICLHMHKNYLRRIYIKCI